MNMTNEEYHAIKERISKSGLDKIAKSPAHYKFEKRKETDAFKIGTITHAYILEGKKEFLIKPTPAAHELVTVSDLKQRCKDLRLKVSGSKADLIERLEDHYPNTPIFEVRAYAIELAAKEHNLPLIKAEEFEEIHAMREAVMRHPAAAKLLSDGQAEQTFFFNEPISGAPCKVRPDWINNGVVVDLKTTVDASPAGFIRSVMKFRYHVQDPFYSDGIQEATGIEIKEFYFIAVEKSPPFAVGVYKLSEELKEQGRELYRENCATWLECYNSKKWPAYSNEIIELI